MTRVLHVAEAFGGGLLEMVRLVATRAAAEGHPQAIAFGRRPETPADLRAAVAPAVALFDPGWGARTPAAEVRAGRRLRAIVRRWEPDVVHLHSSFSGVTGGLALHGLRPIVFTPHAFASQLAAAAPARRAAFAAAERLAVRLADVVGAVGEAEAATARRFGAREVVVIPNGIPELDPDAPPVPRTAHGGRPRAIGVGRLVAQRRPEAVARILGSVRDLADVAWVGGGGEDRLGLQAARRGLEQQGVEMTGWRPREEVLAELGRAAAYVHWTAIDGLPLSILEAMAAGAVVVASDIPPNRELLDPRQLCRTEDEAAAVLRRVLTEPALAAELRALQSARARRHSARAMAEAWIALYARLA